MASKYIRLMEEYKLARKRGEDEKAEKLFKAAREMMRKGDVTEDEANAAMYL